VTSTLVQRRRAAGSTAQYGPKAPGWRGVKREPDRRGCALARMADALMRGAAAFLALQGAAAAAAAAALLLMMSAFYASGRRVGAYENLMMLRVRTHMPRHMRTYRGSVTR
jgi:hypothetical protein